MNLKFSLHVGSNRLTLCKETNHIRCVQFDKGYSSDCTDLRIAWSNLIFPFTRIIKWSSFSLYLTVRYRLDSNLDITPANVDILTNILFCLTSLKLRNKIFMQDQQFPGGFWLSILFIHRAPVTLEPESNCYVHMIWIWLISMDYPRLMVKPKYNIL